jgi:hypothetical protein
VNVRRVDGKGEIGKGNNEGGRGGGQRRLTDKLAHKSL